MVVSASARASGARPGQCRAGARIAKDQGRRRRRVRAARGRRARPRSGRLRRPTPAEVALGVEGRNRRARGAPVARAERVRLIASSDEPLNRRLERDLQRRRQPQAPRQIRADCLERLAFAEARPRRRREGDVSASSTRAAVVRLPLGTVRVSGIIDSAISPTGVKSSFGLTTRRGSPRRLRRRGRR